MRSPAERVVFLIGFTTVTLFATAVGTAVRGAEGATAAAPPQRRSKAAPKASAAAGSPELLSILRTGSSRFQQALKRAYAHEIEIIYTRVQRDAEDRPRLEHLRYRAEAWRYYYPASLVKLPLAALALEKIKRLGVPGLTRDTRLRIEGTGACQPLADTDSTSPTGYPSIAHYIRKAIVVSDGDAYNRLYEFLGPRYINARLRAMGYKSARIIHRFANCSDDENRVTGPVAFLDDNGAQIYRQPREVSPVTPPHPLGTVKRGRAQIINGRRVRRPKDFTGFNFISLEDMHQILIALTLPEAVSESRRFDLTEEDRAYLLNCMSMYPRESDWPSYPQSEFPDGYMKYLMQGVTTGRLDPSIRVYNKVGRAYGYLSDCAYVVDRDNGIEFFLSAVIYADHDGVMNDGRYDYDKVGLPFLSELGELVYRRELARKGK
jgi:hypothetical protein